MLDEKMNREQMEGLAEAMLTLQNCDEAFVFFEDIFTIKELQAVAQRLAVARLLKKRVTYQDIAEQTGASTATISRVNRSLIYGAGGYQMVLSRMKDASEREE
ncbi:MAG: TrpR-like protein YerC/YecD [Clostridia bacterium]|nr:TrpR-like protein YerC/YecD [Clostridia bacterium]